MHTVRLSVWAPSSDRPTCGIRKHARVPIPVPIPAGWDLHVRIKDMDKEGINAAVLYLGFWYPASSSTTEANSRRRSAELTKLAGGLLQALSPASVRHGAGSRARYRRSRPRNAARAVSELGLKGVVIRPSPHPTIGRNLHDPLSRGNFSSTPPQISANEPSCCSMGWISRWPKDEDCRSGTGRPSAGPQLPSWIATATPSSRAVSQKGAKPKDSVP
jgi:hypothetical protein